MPTAREIHASAELAREEGRFSEAIALYSQAFFTYLEQERDLIGASELMAAESILYRRLADSTSDETIKAAWLLKADSNVDQSVLLAKQAAQLGHPEGLALALFNQAKMREKRGDLEGAVTIFTDALHYQAHHPHPDHNQPSVLLDFQLKLQLAQLASSHSDNLVNEIEQLLKSLLEPANGSDAYGPRVWVSGGYLRLARHFATRDQRRARGYYDQAAKIITAHPELSLRLTDLEEVEQLLGTKP